MRSFPPFVGRLRHAVRRLFMFFFFQAEDGIRDYKVTGVQTCALPICMKQSRQLVELAKNVQKKRQAIREKAAAKKAGAEPDEAVPAEWLVAEKPKLRERERGG